MEAEEIETSGSLPNYIFVSTLLIFSRTSYTSSNPTLQLGPLLPKT